METIIDIIAGARPNFMKIAPIIRELEVRKAAGGPLGYRLVHTGQHYDACMSGDFFSQLGIPESEQTPPTCNPRWIAYLLEHHGRRVPFQINGTGHTGERIVAELERLLVTDVISTGRRPG